MADADEPTSKRLFKKRKVIKSRVRQESDSDAERDQLDIAEHRQMIRPRRTGVEFSNATSQLPVAITAEVDVSQPTDHTPTAMDSYAARFARPTGQTSVKNQDEDKHMLAFIESKLSTHEEGHHQMQPLQHSSSANIAVADGAKPQTGVSTLAGTLQEVDLGPDATHRNVQRTHVATQRLEGGPVIDDQSTARRRKPRLGRDGKPFRPRKRRGSEDLARDALVESLLQENRIDVFAPATGANVRTMQNTVDDEGAADERMAEEFKRNYLEQISERHRAPPKKPPTKGEDKSKGPKMGGSRNSRLAQTAQNDKK